MTNAERDELLIELRTGMRQVVQQNADKEKRIRTLEKKWYTSIGAIFVFVVTSLVSLVQFVFTLASQNHQP